MARSKKTSRARKGAKAQDGTAAGSAGATDVAGLVDKAHVLLAQSNFELAIKFLERALELEPTNLEARELAGVAELEGGDAERGRAHLLHLFPPHAAEAPTLPAPYLYLAQVAQDPQEALGYYSTATAMVENTLGGKGKSRAVADAAEVEELTRMAVTAIVAMVEIWMSDLCFEEAASANCDALIARALAIAPTDPEALMALASIRMSQSKFDEAKDVVMRVYAELEGRDPFDPLLPGLPVRLQFSRLLLEHSLQMEALDVLSTVREEDSLEVEGAYLEGWAWHLRAEALAADPTLLDKEKAERGPPAEGEDEDDDDAPLSADECFSESLRCLLECAKLFGEQDYPDQGIGAHLQELLNGLQARGVQPAVAEEAVAGEGEGEDVEMA